MDLELLRVSSLLHFSSQAALQMEAVITKYGVKPNFITNLATAHQL